MQQYVVGFLFNPEKTRVAMVYKHKPEWQRGLFNGIGGKIEPGETPAAAMLREFHEEAGVYVTWKSATILKGIDFEVHVFTATSNAIDDAHTIEREEIVTVDPRALPGNVIPNLKWLIPMLLDPDVEMPVVIYQH